MDEWVARAGIAVVAAVVGAVVRPYVEHWLRRRQHREQRIRERQASIRAMIEQRIEKFRRELHFASTVGVLLEAGLSGDAAFNEASQQAGSIFSVESNGVWQPSRIHDPALRQLCDELNLFIGVLLTFAAGASRGRQWEREELLGKLPFEDLRLKGLEEKIVARMDELGW